MNAARNGRSGSTQIFVFLTIIVVVAVRAAVGMFAFVIDMVLAQHGPAAYAHLASRSPTRVTGVWIVPGDKSVFHRAAS